MPESLKAEPIATCFLERIDAKTLFSISFHLLSDSESGWKICSQANFEAKSLRTLFVSKGSKNGLSRN